MLRDSSKSDLERAKAGVRLATFAAIAAPFLPKALPRKGNFSRGAPIRQPTQTVAAVVEDGAGGGARPMFESPPKASTPVPASSDLPSTHGVTFFEERIAKIVDSPEANLGISGQNTWFMTLEDAGKIRTPSDAARQTGMAPSVERAYLSGGDTYGISFPLDNVTIRAPNALDAGGSPHYFPGGRTAVRTSEGSSGAFLLNDTREFVTPGGGPVPAGSVLFKLGANGEWIPIRRY